MRHFSAFPVLLLCSASLCASLLGCGDDDSPASPDAGLSVVDSGGADASTVADAAITSDASMSNAVLRMATCDAIAARARECEPDFASTCVEDGFRAACTEVMVDTSPLLQIGPCVARDDCIDGVFDAACFASLQTRALPSASVDSVIETLCAACPRMAAGGVAGVTDAAACVDYLRAAVDGSGTAPIQQSLRSRYVLLTEAQLITLRDCVAANPSCDAFFPEECGTSMRQLDMVLSPGWVLPAACE